METVEAYEITGILKLDNLASFLCERNLHFSFCYQ